ncbi:hypothetical protein SCHPADRAFT_934550 [Schizopora paradoxa]|uniref:DNA replication regulator SLD2 n=1 Tax=Schizopora paradoxa TaxID=27342 RepID=A0A0H2SFV8_9AGAM|nr:hypothetical protein SCHPADRAFT_934550 [Schizopora paradoxa]
MTDVHTLRAELKSWEHAFKAKHKRTPTVQDIKDNPEIAAKYKLHKKLNKASQENKEGDLKLDSQRTPSPKQSSSRNQISIVPKAAPVHTGLQSDANPFSPTKKRPAAASSRLKAQNGRFKSPPEESRLNVGVAAASRAPSMLEPPDNVDETQALAVARKARKRLRGDPVSPSPNRYEKKARRSHVSDSPPASPTRGKGTENGAGGSEDVEMSFFDDSPVKPSAGKNFKSLFDEPDKPLPRLLFSSVSAPSQTTTGPSHPPKSELRGGQKSQAKLNTFGVVNGSLRRKFENTLNAPRTGEKSVSASDDSASKRPALREEIVEVGAQTSVESLLPPSPTLPSQGLPKSSKGFTSNRKKAKTKIVVEDTADSDAEDMQALHVIDLDMKDLRRRGLSEGARGSDDEEMLASMRNAEERVDSGRPSDEDAEPEVNLPQDMQKYLHISSSRARERDEGEVVDSLLQGRRRWTRIIKGEVWGVGEMESEDEGGVHTEGDDDWVGEGLPWEAAELSDFEENV